MKNHFLISCVFLLMTSTAGAGEDDEPVIPVLGSKDLPVRLIGAKKLTRALSGIVAQVDQSTLRALEALPPGCQQASPWELRTVSVGLGLSLEAGLTRIMSMKTEARIRLLFSPDSDFVNP